MLQGRQLGVKQRRYINNLVVQHNPAGILSGADKAYPISCSLDMPTESTTAAMPMEAQVSDNGGRNRFHGYGNVPNTHLISKQTNLSDGPV